MVKYLRVSVSKLKNSKEIGLKSLIKMYLGGDHFKSSRLFESV